MYAYTCIRVGVDGEPGKPGPIGPPGKDGTPGADGENGTDGESLMWSGYPFLNTGQ